jgi:ATP-dependent 26S proteasome regulatory subunit
MTATVTTSKGQKTAQDISALLRARNPLIWVTTREEARVEGFLIEAAAAAGYKPLFWDVSQGVTTIDGKPSSAHRGCEDPAAAFKALRDDADKGEKGERQVWIFRDLPAFLEGFPGTSPRRQLRNLAKYLPGVVRKAAQAVIVLTPEGNVPSDIAGHATVIEFPLPDRSEIEKVLDSAVNSVPEFETDPKTGEPDKTKPMRAAACPGEVRDQAINAAVGLTAEEAASCYAKSLVQTRKIDPVIVSNEKKRVIARERVLEWHDPIKGGLDAVGGLENLKKWLVARKSAYSPEAREYGLPAPKGAVLVGISGCGKSLTAKAVATAWGIPLLRLDLGALKDKFVGGSEGNLRKALKVIEAMGRCVVWIDEIEKAMQGSSGGGSSDGGVSADALGTILSWMQERDGEAFVIATANDVSTLPPELLRKGRFDEVFFVDLPHAAERKGVLYAALKQNGRQDVKINFAKVVDATESFTGAEIAELVPTALYSGFEDGAREITTEDLLEAASHVVPLSTSKSDLIKELRKWGQTNARAASTPPKELTGIVGGVEFDL